MLGKMSHLNNFRTIRYYLFSDSKIHFVHACVWICAHENSRGQKTALDALELETQVFVSSLT